MKKTFDEYLEEEIKKQSVRPRYSYECSDCKNKAFRFSGAYPSASCSLGKSIPCDSFFGQYKFGN